MAAPQFFPNISDVALEHVSIQNIQGDYNQYNGGDPDSIELNSMAYASNAGHDATKACLSGTRTCFIDEIEGWAHSKAPTAPRVLWLSGAAGTGKSAVANTIAHRFDRDNKLGSFVGFDRSYLSQRRHEKIFSTISRDLAARYPQVRRVIADTLRERPWLKSTDVVQQWELLLVRPAAHLSDAGPILVVIEAVDESGDPDTRKYLLSILARRSHELPPNFRILVSSRPADDISLTMGSSPDVLCKDMNGIPKSSTDNDIYTYIGSQLTHAGGSFFDSTRIRVLTGLSEGLFQWAFVACDFIISRRGRISNYKTQYRRLTDGATTRALTPLDGLYGTILRTIVDDDSIDLFRSVMGQILGSFEPLSINALTALRAHFPPSDLIDPDDILLVLKHMGSLLTGTSNPSVPIRPLHSSFLDYLTDKSRSGIFSVDGSVHGGDLAIATLEVMKAGLRFNICDLESSYLVHSAVPDLAKRVKRYIASELSYSCRYWTRHLCSTAFGSVVAVKVQDFLNHRFSYWIEALGLLKCVQGAAPSLSLVDKWTNNDVEGAAIRKFVVDARQFLQTFADVISQSTAHQYLAAVPFPVTRPRQLFCLLIGINNYQSSTVPRLSGAVEDANAFRHFFEDNMSVPSENIHFLCNEAATREAIIACLTNLKDDERIHPGDGIFIFFAGHSSIAVESPVGCEIGMTQAMTPYNYCEVPGQEVPPIPRHTLRTLLESIAQRKGHNITVVLDCCYSASKTGDLLGRAFGSLYSHVLLASCRTDEKSREENSRGVFSKALLDAFVARDITKIKYTDLLQILGKLPNQSPQCEGVHQNRYLFNPESLPPSLTPYTLIHRRRSTNDYSESMLIISAGSAHGLAVGDEVTVYPNKIALSRQRWPLERVRVTMVDNYTATLETLSPTFYLTPDTVALKSRYGFRKILKLALQPSHQVIFPGSLLQSPSQEFRNIVCTETPHEAHLTVFSSNGGTLSLQITDPRIVKYRAPPSFRDGIVIEPKELPDILASAIDYFWELDRTNPSGHRLQNLISVEFYQLRDAEVSSDNADIPHEVHRYPVEPSLFRDGEVHTRTAEETMYGIKLTNWSTFDIIPKVYYFNPDNLRIDTVYESPIGLYTLGRQGGVLTIGYGFGSRCPFIPPQIKEGTALQVGFLKIFLYTLPVDGSTSMPTPQPPISKIPGLRPPARPEPTWDTVVIPVVDHFVAIS